MLNVFYCDLVEGFDPIVINISTPFLQLLYRGMRRIYLTVALLLMTYLEYKHGCCIINVAKGH